MDTTTMLLLALLGGVAVLLVLALVALLRGDGAAARRAASERLEQALREEQRAGRAELTQQLESLARTQGQRIDSFAGRLDQFGQRHDTHMRELQERFGDDARRNRLEGAETLKQFGTTLQQSLAALSERSEQRLAEVRTTLETQLKALQADNGVQLEKMRATVDEKLQSTLETRLGQSFKLVSERLEAVQRGLGEMQELATGVGDLKRVLGNVKTRGMLGEVQLGALLEQVLVAEQYAANVAPVPGQNERVEFAVRLPGADAEHPVWLPIDAKFPREDYERLLDAQEQADADAVHEAGLALERRVRAEAKAIHGKYVAPPATTDFAILFLPTEGLYAEVIRRPGLFEALQRDCCVTVAGPTTLVAILNALQMGFRTLAIQKRSSEVWQTLGAVKTEFGKFAEVLDKTRKQLDTVRNSIDSAGVRTRAIERKLRDVESLPEDEARQQLVDVPELSRD
ncbi:MAG TPA: DNA recombination protein RmuC [Rhodanobacteraceae bacterium]|nr:DNA recombination protein RmuC [Rhodanobacteraceae bacterium]